MVVIKVSTKDPGQTERHEKRLALFIENLGHPEAPYRWGAAEALGRMEDPRAVEALIPLLSDPDWRVRMKTAWALGRIGDARAAPYLHRLARDESEAVRDMAKEAVQELLKQRFREYSPDRA
jgi:HEAT repeat protein